MKLKNFTYQDLKGKITNRQVLVIQEPSDKMSAIDVTGIPDDQVVDFAVEYDVIYKSFLAEVEALKSNYDLRFSFRQFFPGSMVNVEAEEV